MDYGSILRHFSQAISSKTEVILSFDSLEFWAADINSIRVTEENICATGIFPLAQEIVKTIHYPRKVIDSEHLREKRELEEFRRAKEMQELINKHSAVVLNTDSASIYQKRDDILDAHEIQKYVPPTEK